MRRLRVAGTMPLLYSGANLEQGSTCTRTGDASRTNSKISKAVGTRTASASAPHSRERRFDFLASTGRRGLPQFAG
jgi:hypothetical protein